MKMSDLGEVLQSSCLAPLFVDLDKLEKEEKEDVTVYKLEVANPFSDKEPVKLSIIEDDTRISIMVRGLAETKDPNLIARVAHVNHLVKIPKFSWDPDDGEVYAEWTLYLEDGGEVSPVVFERVTASILYVFYGERKYFLRSELQGLFDKGLISKEQAEAIIDQTAERLEKDFFPAIRDVLSD